MLTVHLGEIDGLRMFFLFRVFFYGTVFLLVFYYYVFLLVCNNKPQTTTDQFLYICVLCQRVK